MEKPTPRELADETQRMAKAFEVVSGVILNPIGTVGKVAAHFLEEKCANCGDRMDESAHHCPSCGVAKT